MQPILELVAVGLILVAKYARTIRSAMRDLEISPRSRNCAFDACSVSHFSSLSYLSPSYSLPCRTRSLFVRLPTHSFLSSFHLFIFYLIPAPTALFPFNLRFFALDFYLFFELLLILHAHTAHRMDTGWEDGLRDRNWKSDHVKRRGVEERGTVA